MQIRSIYKPEGEKIVSVNSQPSMTQQHFRDECNINTIMHRYEQTGILGDPGRATRQAFYDDFSTGFDFQQCQNAIIAATDAFMSIPAEIRYRFHNSPHEFVKFIQDPQNHDECVKLGFFEKPIVSEPEKVRDMLKKMADDGQLQVKLEGAEGNLGEPPKTVVSGVPEPPKGGKKTLAQ